MKKQTLLGIIIGGIGCAVIQIQMGFILPYVVGVTLVIVGTMILEI